MTYDLIVIGGGASGFFAAIQVATLKPGFKIVILEKSSRVLQKVKVSGGGRCNVTYHCFEKNELAKHYPRGQKELKKLFSVFQAKDTVAWFEDRDVKLKAESDGRMFPVTNNSQTIIDCFINEADRLKIKVELKTPVTEIRKIDSLFSIHSSSKIFSGKNVLIGVGGFSSLPAYGWLAKLGFSIIPPIPSLFTFNDSQNYFKDLMGVSVPSATVKIAGTNFSSAGPVLITHWGLSGPAVIRLSAWAATYLHACHYQFTVLVSWVSLNENEMRKELKNLQKINGKKKILSSTWFGLPIRLWLRLCEISEIPKPKIWSELSQRHLNKLVENLVRCPFEIKGKTTFKEEFVTCGGIDLREIELSTMESKKVKGLFFAGEVLDMDGETGGFNFQAAWTTAYMAAMGMLTLRSAS